jgi:hypothetical protein
LHCKPPRLSLRHFSRKLTIKRFKPRTPLRFRKGIRCRAVSGGLLGWECRKLWYNPKIVLLLMALILLKGGLTWMDIREHPITQQELFYRDYMTSLGGRLTEQTEELIRQEQEWLDEAVLLRGELSQMEGVTKEQLEELWATVTEARQKEDSFELFYARYQSILSEPDVARREQMVLLYDTGWNKLLQLDYDFLAYLCVALLCSVLFTQEKESRFDSILRTTTKGRIKTFRSKVILALLFSGLIALAFWVFDVAVIEARYTLPEAEAPLMSLGIYRDVPATWTLGGYLWVVGTTRVCFTMLIALLFVSLSEPLGSGLFTLLISTIVVPLPALVFGKTTLPWRLSDALSGNVLLHQGFADDAWQGTGIIVIYLSITLTFLLITYQRYAKGIKK